MNVWQFGYPYIWFLHIWLGEEGGIHVSYVCSFWCVENDSKQDLHCGSFIYYIFLIFSHFRLNRQTDNEYRYRISSVHTHTTFFYYYSQKFSLTNFLQITNVSSYAHLILKSNQISKSAPQIPLPQLSENEFFLENMMKDE